MTKIQKLLTCGFAFAIPTTALIGTFGYLEGSLNTQISNSLLQSEATSTSNDDIVTLADVSTITVTLENTAITDNSLTFLTATNFYDSNGNDYSVYYWLQIDFKISSILTLTFSTADDKALTQTIYNEYYASNLDEINAVLQDAINYVLSDDESKSDDEIYVKNQSYTISNLSVNFREAISVYADTTISSTYNVSNTYADKLTDSNEATLEEENKALEEEIAALEKEIAALEEELAEANQALEDANKALEEANQSTDDDNEAANQTIAELEEKIADLQSQINSANTVRIILIILVVIFFVVMLSLTTYIIVLKRKLRN